MISIATLGPEGSNGHIASVLYDETARTILKNTITEALQAVDDGEAEVAIVPVYNTREGEVKDYFRFMETNDSLFWVDNVVLSIQVSLGYHSDEPFQKENIETIFSRSSVFKQSEEYIRLNYPEAVLVSVKNIQNILDAQSRKNDPSCCVIETESLLRTNGYQIVEREVVSHNRTRFAVVRKKAAKATGYDATSFMTRPLNDRVGMLVDILNEFTRRGVNILDLRSENDIKTQKLRIYIEAEGHISDHLLNSAISTIEKKVIQEQDNVKILGSFPRVDMRVKNIQNIGFIGSGDMSLWFAERLESEGYKAFITGRSTELSPEEMIKQVDVVILCVPISVTAENIRRYGPLLNEGQAMIILAGESEKTLNTAVEVTSDGVEVMLVHNLWGPQAMTMKDKNVSVVRTSKSGSFCSEFEAFLYKHGAEIFHDSPREHDLLMGVAQKLPTIISVALARTLAEHKIDCSDISSHSTLTSIYGLLSMVRVHNQNHRTYAEIMSTSGEGRKIVRTFAKNIKHLMDLSEQCSIKEISDIMAESRNFMTRSFIKTKMMQAKAVDALLSDSTAINDY